MGVRFEHFALGRVVQPVVVEGQRLVSIHRHRLSRRRQVPCPGTAVDASVFGIIAARSVRRAVPTHERTAADEHSAGCFRQAVGRERRGGVYRPEVRACAEHVAHVRYAPGVEQLQAERRERAAAVEHGVQARCARHVEVADP